MRFLTCICYYLIFTVDSGFVLVVLTVMVVLSFVRLSQYANNMLAIILYSALVRYVPRRLVIFHSTRWIMYLSYASAHAHDSSNHSYVRLDNNEYG